MKSYEPILEGALEFQWKWKQLQEEQSPEALEEGIKNTASRFFGRHKRCPEGTHWNDQDATCKKASDAFHGLRKSADDASKKAWATKKDPQKEPHHTSLYRAHRAAADAHTKVATAAHKKGYHDLGQEHEDKARKHNHIVRKYHYKPHH